MTAAVEAPAGFEIEDRHARALLRDLQTPRPAVYWLDLIVTAAIGWGAFAAAARLPFSLSMLACAAAAVFALYRGLCFLHEIAHINKRSLRGFEAVWNILIGFPLLMPSFLYVGVHQAHHSLSSYGTSEDPGVSSPSRIPER